MKNLFLILVVTLFPYFGRAVTNITTPMVSGHWTLAGSPYKIYNDITVDHSNNLTIDPGVDIVFQGSYKMSINGSLYSAGTVSQPISYYVQDTTGWLDANAAIGGWGGIAFGDGYTLPDSSSFQYCNVSYMKSGCIRVSMCNLIIKTCNFSHNTAVFSSYLDSTEHIEIADCNIYDNSSTTILNLSGGSMYVHDCKIHDNNSDVSTITSFVTNLLFVNNELYQNSQISNSLGGTLLVLSSSAVIQNNKFHHNASSTIAALSCQTSNVDINRNIFCNNSAIIPGGYTCGGVQGGGGVRINSGAIVPNTDLYTIRNNVIANNYTTAPGAGIYVLGANADIFNNQIVNNSSQAGGSGLYIVSLPSEVGPSFVRIKNNLFYHNEYSTMDSNYNQSLWLQAVDTMEFDHNWIEQPFYLNTWFGSVDTLVLKGDTLTNVIGITPNMVNPTLSTDVAEDATSANFGLLPTSACIDKGDISNINVGQYDYLGNPRIYGNKIDIGAFEYNPTLEIIGQSSTTTSLQAYPNPAVNVLFISTPQAKGLLQIRDISGRVILEKSVINVLTSFDVKSIARGVYFATWITDNSENAVQKVILE
jgi:hypothetical protein